MKNHIILKAHLDSKGNISDKERKRLMKIVETIDKNIVGLHPFCYLLYAEWCGHCKNMKPEWNAALKYIDDSKDIKVIEIDFDTYKVLKELNKSYKFIEILDHQFIGFPHIGFAESVQNKDNNIVVHTASSSFHRTKEGFKQFFTDPYKSFK